MHSREAHRPWYREPWTWFLMALPLTAVLAGIVTVWLAVGSDDGLVTDDYYKKGLAINQTLARDDNAEQMGLVAHLRLSEPLSLELRAREGVTLPPGVRLLFSHPTRAGMDHAVVLAGSGGRYQGSMESLPNGRWQIIIEDEARTWRLTGSAQIPEDREISITASSHKPVE